MNIVLYQPEIPYNTGNIGRSCVLTNSTLHLIKPLGFSLDEKQVKNFFFNQLEYDPSSFGGESFLEVRERVAKGLDKFIDLNKDYERVLVVSHGATLKTLLHYISGKDISTLSDEVIPKNTSYTIVKYENGKFEIIDFSNVSHLEGKL